MNSAALGALLFSFLFNVIYYIADFDGFGLGARTALFVSLDKRMQVVEFGRVR